MGKLELSTGLFTRKLLLTISSRQGLSVESVPVESHQFMLWELEELLATATLFFIDYCWLFGSHQFMLWELEELATATLFFIDCCWLFGSGGSVT
jgi:hypothetical protein